MTTSERIRRVVGEFGGITTGVERLSDDTDLFAAGMTSHASVNVMLALESEFGIEFPDEMLKPVVFQSISNLVEAISELQSQPV